MMIISSVMLQKSLKRFVQIKIGSSEIGMLPLYFRRALSNFKVEDVMSEDFEKIPHTMTISDYLQKYRNAQKNSNLVFDKDEKLVGAISPKEINKVNKALWTEVSVGKISEPHIALVTFDEYLFTVVQKLNSQHFDLIPVMSINYDKVIGVVNSQMIMNLLIQEEKK